MHRHRVLVLVAQGLRQFGHRRQGIVDLVVEGGGQRNIVGIVHPPIAARRRERVVRVGERDFEEKRLVRAGRPVVLQIGERLFGDIAGRIELFRHLGAPRRGRRILLVRQGVVGADQGFSVAALVAQPRRIVPRHLVTMARAQADMIEAVMGQLDLAVGVGLPGERRLALIGRTGHVAHDGVAQGLGRVGEVGIERRGRRRGPPGHVLDVALADQRGAIAGRAQQIDEGHTVGRQGQAVMARAMGRRHAPGDQAGAVGHADRRGDVEALEGGAAGGQAIDVGGVDDGVAVTAQMIGPMLVGHEQNEIRFFCHHAPGTALFCL